jgi:hypothetical protein
MPRRARRLYASIAMVLSLGGVLVACGAEHIAGPLTPPLQARSWTVILTDSTGRVWIAQTAVVPAPLKLPIHVSAALWSRFDSQPLLRDLVFEARVEVRPAHVYWQLRAAGAEAPVAFGDGAPQLSPTYGIWQVRGRAHGEVSGARRLSFDLLSDTPLPVDTFIDRVPSARVVVRTPAVISLRIDDCARADSVGFRLLTQYGMTASLAVPTSVIDRPWACGQPLMNAMAAAGGRIEAHSRTHGPTPGSFAEFYLETVGAAQDLRVRGFDPKVFVVPGSWRAGRPEGFDSPNAMVGPYWQLLRRVYMTVDGGLFAAACAIPRPGRDGPVSWPLRAFTPDSLERRIRHAVRDSMWIHFMWHSVDMPAAVLEARLRVIAALRDSGLVTVLPFYTALHATRP